ncbi:App1 family protein [Altererythrobacter sp. CAU 1778]
MSEGSTSIDWLMGPPARVQPYFGHRSGQRIRLSARVLRAPPHEYSHGATWQKMRSMWHHFASREVANQKVVLEIPCKDTKPETFELVSDHEGYVHFDVTAARAMDVPSATMWEELALSWVNRAGPQTAPAHVLTPGSGTALGVISDVDDTIVETGITGGIGSALRNWRRLLAQMPEERDMVGGADAFYGMLGSGGADSGATPRPHAIAATVNPFFYVSSSPWNLYSYLVEYKRAKGLPLGPIALRDWGLNRATLGSASHGEHKRAAIAAILDMHTRLRFVLIGDDTQGDLPAYAEIAREHGDRIAAIFIRKAGAPLSPEELAAKNTIAAADIPLWLGEDFAEAGDLARQVGLVSTRKADAIVETMVAAEQGATSAP